MIAVGARFDDRVTGKADEWVPTAKIIHIDVDPAEIGKVLAADVPIVGDVQAVLTELLKIVGTGEASRMERPRGPVEAGLPAALPR